MPDLPKSPVPPVLPKKIRGQDSPLHRLFGFFEEWYDSIGHAGRDRVDQVLHTLAGFVLGFLFPGWVSWAIDHHREFVTQAPIERIDDTQRDMGFWLLGTAMGWSARWGLIFFYVMRVLSQAR